MNKDAVRVDQIDLPTVFPTLRLLDSLRVAWSMTCLIAAALVSAGFQIQRPTTVQKNPLGLVSILLEMLPTIPSQLTAHLTTLAISDGGLRMWITLMIRLTCIGFCATAIARCTAMTVTRNERLGVIATARCGLQRWKPIIVSTSLVLTIGFMIWASFRLVGLISLWVSGSAETALVPGIGLWIYSTLMLIAAAVLLTGWLIGLSAIAVDDVDGAEALSRGISYVLSRFRRTISYAILILLLAELAGRVTRMSLTFSAEIAFRSISTTAELTSKTPPWFEGVRAFGVDCVELSVICCGLAIVYLILRRVVDNVELREIAGHH